MRDEYDFSNASKNPFAEKMKQGYAVTIHYGTQNGEDISEGTAVTPDDVDMDRIKSILARPGLKSLHLHFHKPKPELA